jgi:hydroxyacylglutathione hydrolase
MLIHVFPSGPFSTNTYLVAYAHTREAAVIDPAPDSFFEIQPFIVHHKLHLRKILLTHSHWDHIADVKKFKDEYAAPVYIHSFDVPNLKQPGSDGLPCWLEIPSVEPDMLLEEGMEVTVGELKLQVIHTPGHSPGSVCFYEPKEKILLSGDTVFKGTMGNLSFPTSQPSLMGRSLAKLARLPADTKVFPGHGPTTTIGEESSWMLAFAANDN